jgi:hypothetical protein
MNSTPHYATGQGTGQELTPVAPMLMQSLRAVGYTVPAALADLVDNSIAAHAKQITIRFSPVDEPFVAIIDDGKGMSEAELVEAMRFGSQDPRDARTGRDLGRFGLGLKTASLSQCRRLTVASLQNGNIAMARWDLDECDRRKTWWLQRPSAVELPPEVLEKLRNMTTGTAVVWQQLDRIVEPPAAATEQLNKALEESADHLALCFHRYLSGKEFGEDFSIDLNGRPLPVLDPFLEGHARGQSLHDETFIVEGREVRVSPFVLPFPSRLKADVLDRAGGRERLKTGHGFYIYRGGRLVVPGGWHRIVPTDELARLARIRVDVPVELDRIWKTDIKKSSAELPPALRGDLKRIVRSVSERSRTVYTHRGTPAIRTDFPVWRRMDGRDGAAAWSIDRHHPLIAAFSTGLAADAGPQDLERLIRLLEISLPLQEIYVHMSNDLPVDHEVPADKELEAMAMRIADQFSSDPEDLRQVFEQLPRTEPFSRNPEATRRILMRLMP